MEPEEIEKWERDAAEPRGHDTHGLIARATKIIKYLGDALDACHAREIRDEETIASLHQKFAGHCPHGAECGNCADCEKQ